MRVMLCSSIAYGSLSIAGMVLRWENFDVDIVSTVPVWIAYAKLNKNIEALQ